MLEGESVALGILRKIATSTGLVLLKKLPVTWAEGKEDISNDEKPFMKGKKGAESGTKGVSKGKRKKKRKRKK